MARIGFLSHLDLNLYLFRLPIMRSLKERGHEVFAICPEGAHSQKMRDLGLHVTPYAIERQSLNPLKELFALRAITEALRPLKLDLLHTFTAKPNIYGTLAARRLGIPTVLNLVEGLGSFYIEDSLKNRLVRFVMERLYKHAFARADGAVFVNSDDPEYMIERALIERKKVQVIKSVGIDTEAFSPQAVSHEALERLREALHVKEKTVVLMVARAIWHKGVREYYEAAEALADDKVLFLLVGDTDAGNPSSADEDFLRRGTVQWLGHRDDIVELTALCDLYVLPSYREGVPRTLLEAASMGKAIVTTDVVGCREVVDHGVNGLLVHARDSDALTEAIRTLLLDPERRAAMGALGRAKAIAQFDTQAVVAQYLTLYGKFIHV